MKKEMKRIIAFVLSGILALSNINVMEASAAGSENIYPTFNETTKEYDYYKDDIFGAATRVHFFGNYVETIGHTHGNVMTNELKNGEIGMRSWNYVDGHVEYSFVGDLLHEQNSNLNHDLIIGEDMTVSNVWGQMYINNKWGSTPYNVSAEKMLGNIWSSKNDSNPLDNVDDGVDAVDIQGTLDNVAGLSKKWANSTTSGVESVVDLTSDQNYRYIDTKQTTAPNKNIFIELSPADVSKYTNRISIRGLDTDEKNVGIVVFNIDMEGYDTFNCSSQIDVYDGNGTQYITNDEHAASKFGSCRIVYNFYDSSEDDFVYRGKVNFSEVIFGTIIAPGAEVTVGAINGNVIADKIYHNDKESHRLDVLAFGVTPANDEPAPPVPEVGNLKVTVTEKDNASEKIEGAVITITGPNYSEEKTTDGNGEVNVTGLPAGKYTVTITDVPDAYESCEPTTLIKDVAADANATTEYPFEVKEKAATSSTGSITVIVLDVTNNSTGIPVMGVPVQVGSNDPVKTNSNGEFSKDKLTPGNYAVTITQPTGYKIVNTTNGTNVQPAIVEANQGVVVTFELKKDIADLDITVTDKKDPNTKIPGATVNLTDKNGNNKHTGTTDNNGYVKFEDIPQGDYNVVVTVKPESGYDAPDPKPVTVPEKGLVEENVQVEKDIADLEVTVTDKKDPNKKIPNATVELKDKNGNVVDTQTSDANGNVAFDNVPKGDYTIEVTVPENSGYEAPDTKPVTVPEKGLVEEEVQVEKDIADLEVTVTDKKDPNKKVPNATVALKDKDGKVVATQTTDNAGKVTFKNTAKGDYTIVVTVPENSGYEAPDNKPVTVPEKGLAKEEVPVGQIGSLVIVVKDEKTNAVVPGAELIIKDAAGNVIGTVTTDAEGKVKKDNLPVGEYTVVVNKVPSGYSVSTNKELKNSVVAKQETPYEFKVTKEETTDNNSTSTQDTPPAQESAPAPAPAETNTSATSADNGISANNVTPKDAAGIATAPKTGDPIMGVFFMMMMAAGIGLITVADYRRRNNSR